MRSSSSIIMEHLKALPEGARTTNSQLVATLNLTSGSVSGFMFRLVKEGGAVIVDQQRNATNGKKEDIYQTVPGVLDKINVKGKAPERDANTASRHVATSRERLVNLLMSIAQDIDGMKCSLSDYSADELVKELGRRAKG